MTADATARPDVEHSPDVEHRSRVEHAHLADDFAARHIGPGEGEVAHMLARLGYDSLDALTEAAVPRSIAWTERLDLPEAVSEPEVLAQLRTIAEANTVHRSMIGLGYHGTHTPPVITRNVLENPAWYTAYTPYQPEISQGRLEALLNFQTAVSDLTGLDIANASMLDEATAAAEAMTLIKRTAKSKSQRFVVDADTLPQTIAVIQTRAEPIGIEVVIAGAGLSAALPGVIAAHTVLPVIGVPIKGGAMDGIDSLLSIAQMPAGVPVGTLAIGEAGAVNAALLAAAILGLSDPALAARLSTWREAQTAGVAVQPS